MESAGIRTWISSRRKELGESIDEKHISKHKKDVFRLGAGLLGSELVLPQKIRTDLKAFVDLMEKERPEVGSLLKLMGVRDLTGDDILVKIRQIFSL